MSQPRNPSPTAFRDAAVLLLAGLVLGAAYNAWGLAARRPWGVSWIAAPRSEALAALPAVHEAQAPPGRDSYTTNISDPLAVPTTDGAQAGLPEIPAAGRAVQIELGAVLQLVQGRAALLLDAREPAEYAAGHIPGARSLPYERAASDPALLESIDAAGQPIVVYCGGGTCELSLELAEELIFAGFDRVAVFVGGYPDWVAAGGAVETGLGEPWP